MMGRTLMLILIASTWTLLACGQEGGSTSKTPSVALAGTYHVSGATVPIKGGAKRDVEGTVILAQDGDRYTATFDLVHAAGVVSPPRAQERRKHERKRAADNRTRKSRRDCGQGTAVRTLPIEWQLRRRLAALPKNLRSLTDSLSLAKCLH